MNNIDEIMELINWNKSIQEQQKGIRLAKEVTCLKAFFRPQGTNGGKGVWENCAFIICERSDEELAPYLEDMLIWIEDLNWPGAWEIQERLIQFRDVKSLAAVINRFVPALKKLEMRSWLFFIAPLVENTALENELDPEVSVILHESLKL